MRIFYLIRKEFIQTFQDKRMMMLIFVVPVLQLVVFGFAVTMDIRNISTAVNDRDNTAESREFIQSLASSGYFQIKAYIQSDKDINKMFQARTADVVVSIPQDFARHLKRLEKAPMQILLDGSDSNFAAIAMNHLTQIVKRYSDKYTNQMIERAKGKIIIPSVAPQIRVWYNPDLKSSDYMVPGVICFILLIVTSILTSMAIIREKEIGTMEQLIVTPIKPYELMLGKIIPFAVIGLFDVVLILTAAVIIFGITVKGSVLLLFVLTAFFLLSTLGLGLFVSTISHTQQQAMMTTFFFIQPSIILSGFFFPIENMPKMFQYLTYINPVRYYLIILRGIFLKGNGLEVLWPESLALLVFGAAIITLSVMRFKKRLG